MAITIRAVSKRFGDAVALDHVSLNVEPGSLIVGFLSCRIGSDRGFVHLAVAPAPAAGLDRATLGVMPRWTVGSL